MCNSIYSVIGGLPLEHTSSVPGKMNENSWDLKTGKDRTNNKNKKTKKDRPHYKIKKIKRVNKKHGRIELTKKGSRTYSMVRCN